MCPSCKNKQVVAGYLVANGRSLRITPAFRPLRFKWYNFTWMGGAVLAEEIFGCPSCGLVWGSVDPKAMARDLHDLGKPPKS
jgi:hypothetical protein